HHVAPLPGDHSRRADDLGRPRLLLAPGPWPLDDGQLSAYAAEPGRHTWTALSPEGRPVGHASPAGTRLGRVLIAPGARGRELGAAMVSLVVERVFGELGVPELGLGVWAHTRQPCASTNGSASTRCGWTRK
ncbi:hypothetical protein OTB23_43140, partial [Streptomyces sp. H34-AA3]|nr:hypothetical protein [Streptomyces sp. H34-AA3]